MLRRCKENVVAFFCEICYDEAIKRKGGFPMMKLSEKITMLRKQNGMSQEELAEKLGVSRQAISRWEMGSAMPDAGNLLQISKLFGVTADYLLNDDYVSDNDIPKIQKVKEDHTNQILLYLIMIEVLAVLIQAITAFFLPNLSVLFGILSMLPFAAAIFGFEYAYRKNDGKQNERTYRFREKFYKISAWLGAYFPIRLLTSILAEFLLPMQRGVLECIVLVLYIVVVILLNLGIDKSYMKKK